MHAIGLGINIFRTSITCNKSTLNDRGHTIIIICKIERTVVIKNAGDDVRPVTDVGVDGCQTDQDYLSWLNLIIAKDGNKRGAKFINSWRKCERLRYTTVVLTTCNTCTSQHEPIMLGYSLVWEQLYGSTHQE